MVRESAIQFKVERDERAGKMFENFGQDHTGHTIARIGHDFERLDLTDIDKREDVSDIIIGDIAFDDFALARRSGEVTTDGQIADIGQAGIQADWESLRATEFDAVVFAWVV